MLPSTQHCTAHPTTHTALLHYTNTAQHSTADPTTHPALHRRPYHPHSTTLPHPTTHTALLHHTTTIQNHYPPLPATQHYTAHPTTHTAPPT